MKLVDGKHRDEFVRQIGTHIDTGYWPQTLSETLESILRKQAIQTLDEVARLMATEGADLQRIISEKKALQDSLVNPSSLITDDSRHHATQSI